MRFWINNVSGLTVVHAIGVCASVPIFILFVFLLFLFPDWTEVLFAVIAVIPIGSFIIYYGYLRNKYFEVKYDGFRIIYNCFFGEKTIDIASIKTMSFYFEREYSRYPRNNYQVLKIEFYDTFAKPVELYDLLTDETLNLISCHGSHVKSPLLLMYDDIIAKYPDKMGGIRGWR